MNAQQFSRLYHSYIVNTSYLLSYFDKTNDLRAFPYRDISQGYSAGSDGLSREVDWASFEDWLLKKGLRRKHAMDMVRYARRYSGVFFKGRLSEIEAVNAKQHVLMALSDLAKYLRQYKMFRELREQSGIKWTNKISDSLFFDIYEGKQAARDTEAWMDSLKQKLKWECWFPCAFMGLTGLRPNEAVTSLNMIVNGEMEKGYLNRDLGVLEHFLYREKFLRKTKKAFISILTGGMLEKLNDWNHKTSYWKLRSYFMRHGIECRLYNLRKWYATTLKENGVPTEFVDLVEGRVPSTVFMRYYRPDVAEIFEKVRKVIESYEKKWLF